jgi:hypothetical protein
MEKSHNEEQGPDSSFSHNRLGDVLMDRFVTEYEIDGEKYAGEIWATSWEDASKRLEKRKLTEKIVGYLSAWDGQGL